MGFWKVYSFAFVCLIRENSQYSLVQGVGLGSGGEIVAHPSTL